MPPFVFHIADVVRSGLPAVRVASGRAGEPAPDYERIGQCPCSALWPGVPWLPRTGRPRNSRSTFRRTPGRKLAALLADTHGTGRIHVAGEDLRTLVVGVPPLVNGSVLVDGGQGGHAQASPPAMLLVAHSGPAAGAMYPVLRGRNLIGRGTAHISVPDPDISREHAALDVSFADLTLTACRRIVPRSRIAARPPRNHRS